MTTQEKLQHFYETTIADANRHSQEMLDEYQSALNQVFEEHKADALRKAELQIQLETEQLQRENNKKFSMEQIQIKRITNKKHDELKERLLIELKDKLEGYMSSQDYQLLLLKQIKEAREFAKDEELIVYLDPADSGQKNSLEAAAGIPLSISRYSFMGGTRAVIPSRNILIDNSFEKRLEEMKNQFSIEGGRFHE